MGKAGLQSSWTGWTYRWCCTMCFVNVDSWSIDVNSGWWIVFSINKTTTWDHQAHHNCFDRHLPAGQSVFCSCLRLAQNQKTAVTRGLPWVYSRKLSSPWCHNTIHHFSGAYSALWGIQRPFGRWSLAIHISTHQETEYVWWVSTLWWSNIAIWFPFQLLR